jgi:hypothetical protein
LPRAQRYRVRDEIEVGGCRCGKPGLAFSEQTRNIGHLKPLFSEQTRNIGHLKPLASPINGHWRVFRGGLYLLPLPELCGWWKSRFDHQIRR